MTQDLSARSAMAAMPQTALKRYFFPSVLLVSLLLDGCGSGTYPVRGLVRFDDGQAAVELAGGSVRFEGLDGGVIYEGEIRMDATFELSTPRGDGASPGEYRVTITPPPSIGPEVQPPPVLIDPRYGHPDSTPLRVIVQAGANDVILEVQRPGGNAGR